jgi:hypothetical protein
MSNRVDDIWRALKVEKAEAADFLAMFARFEYALKRCHYLQIRDPGAKAQPNWDTFASAVQKAASEAQIEAVWVRGAYLVKHPTRKQIVANETLDWADGPPRPSEPSLSWLLGVVRDTRNNLFHGGKFVMGPVRDPLRDQQLIEASVEVLLACLELECDEARQVRDVFWRMDDAG